MSKYTNGFLRTIPVILACVAYPLLYSGCGLLNPDEPGNLVPKTVAEDPTLPSAEINGTQLHLETLGNPADPTIVFLHGGPGGDYRGLTRLCGLADRCHLVLFDQRGSSLSKRHDPGEISCALYIADLEQIVDRYGGGGPVVLLGRSWGCQYAVMYTAAKPGRVSKLILIDPGPLTGEDYGVYFLPKSATDLTDPWISDWEWSEEFISPDTHARLDYRRMLGALHFNPEFNISKTDVMPSWRLGAVANAVIMSAGMKSGRPEWDFTQGLESFGGEVLFIRGGLNGIMTEEYMEHVMRSYFSHTRNTYVTIPGAGHDQAWVKADETVAAIRSFL
jgi:proline iminopeptidase